MPEESGATVVVRRNGWGRIASFIALGVLVVLAIAIAVLWTQRRSIATHFLKGEFERRNVQASYHLDRVGFRTQQVSNLIVGDPKRPDLTAKNALIQMRLKWDGNFQVYRVVARGVRLRGRLVHGSCRRPATSRSRCPTSCSTSPTAAFRLRLPLVRSASQPRARVG